MGDRDRRDDRYHNIYRPRSPGPRPRSPGPRIDSYRVNRSPVRHRSPPRTRGVLAADTYTPGSRASRPRSRSPPFRRRSRSPRERRDDDRWRARPRSPPRRAFSPRRDESRDDRGRSPRRGGFSSYRGSPRVRDRSPPPRERDASPAPSRGMRSPLRPNRYPEPRSRAHSPNRRFSPPRDTRNIRRRSPSPRRDRTPFTADTWRRKSPSPPRPAYTSNDVTDRESAATSRRSSPPPVHPSRLALVEDIPMRDAAPEPPRSPLRDRVTRDRERELEGDRDYGREAERERPRSPPRHRDAPPTGPRGDREFAPPSGPSSSYRNTDNSFVRAPPTGPSGRGFPSVTSPPTGPSNPGPQPPTFPRGNHHGIAAPTRPSGRGRGGFGYDAPRDFSGPPPRRGSAHWGGRGGAGFHGGPPSGPRGSMSGPSGPNTFPPPYRGSSNNTSTTYPRTQRFRDHLTDLPKEIPGGQRAPDLVDSSKLQRIEEDARKLRELIASKEAGKREALKEWEAMGRDVENATLKTELAEQHLRSLTGEGETAGTAY